MLCSCETTSRPAVVRTRIGGVQTKEVKSYAVSSVFTPQSNRGKGYASLIMQILGQKLNTECEFDALYSDIGKVGISMRLTLLMVDSWVFFSLTFGIRLELLTLYGE